jgi:hypothetical protein
MPVGRSDEEIAIHDEPAAVMSIAASASVVKHRQLELAKALGVGDQVVGWSRQQRTYWERPAK